MAEPHSEPTDTIERQTIRTRLVLNFPGFEKTDSEAQLGRMHYCAQNSGSAWGYETTEPAIEAIDGSHHSQAGFATKGGDWNTKTDLVQFRWNDIVHKYEFAPFPSGFLRDLWKFLKFFADGTVLKYQRASGRYFTFTIFPFLLMAVFAIISWFVLGYLGLGFWMKLVLTALITLVLCKWPGTRLYVPMTVADWGFARDMVNRSNKEIEDRFKEFGETLLEQIENSTHDEIVIVGHSFGAVWAVSALAQALKEKPDLISGKQISFLALGSSIPKIALAPKAGWLRDQMATVIAQTGLFWHEFQTKDDLIAFYKSHPFEVLGLTGQCEFALDRMRFSKGMEKKRYRKVRRSFFDTHRQYILYYDKRVGFDYMLRLFGPFSIRQLDKMEDPTNALDEHGTLR